MTLVPSMFIGALMNAFLWGAPANLRVLVLHIFENLQTLSKIGISVMCPSSLGTNGIGTSRERFGKYHFSIFKNMHNLLRLGLYLRRYSSVNQEMQTASMRPRWGLSTFTYFVLFGISSDLNYTPVRSSRCRKPCWASCWGTSPPWRPAPGRCWRATGTWCPCLWFLTLNRGDELIEALTWRTVICEAFQKCPKGSSGTQQASPIGCTMYIGEVGRKSTFQMIEL